MSEPAQNTPSTPAAGPPADPRRLAAVLVQRVGRAPLVLGGTVLLLALWTGAFLLSERKQTRGPAQPSVPPPSAEPAPGTRELIQRFLEESRRQAAQEAAAQADRYPQQDTGELSGFPPDRYGPQQPEMPPAPEWEPREEPRQADRRSDPSPRDPSQARLERALEAPPLVSVSRTVSGVSAGETRSPIGDLLAATERLAQLAQPPAPGAALGGSSEVLPAILQSTAPAAPTAPISSLRPTHGRPASPYTLSAGSLIPAVLTSAVNSDAPGSVSAVVSHDVFNSPTGASLLIPAGSRLLGASGTATHGQNRLEITWSRLTLPDGTTYELGAMPAADSTGATGLRDRTNRHLARTFGSALLLSAFTAAAQLSQPDSYGGTLRAPTAQEVAAGALGQQVNATAGALIDRELRVPPTLVLRPGMGCNVVVTTDLVFPGPSRR